MDGGGRLLRSMSGARTCSSLRRPLTRIGVGRGCARAQDCSSRGACRCVRASRCGPPSGVAPACRAISARSCCCSSSRSSGFTARCGAGSTRCSSPCRAIRATLLRVRWASASRKCASRVSWTSTTARSCRSPGSSRVVSLPFLDAAAARERLLNVPLVKDATVRKLYPNALSITVVERDPFALWQHDGEVYVVSVDGTVIDRLQRRALHTPSARRGRGRQHQGRWPSASCWNQRARVAGPCSRGNAGGRTAAGTLKMDNGVDVKLPEEGAARGA